MQNAVDRGTTSSNTIDLSMSTRRSNGPDFLQKSAEQSPLCRHHNGSTSEELRTRDTKSTLIASPTGRSYSVLLRTFFETLHTKKGSHYGFAAASGAVRRGKLLPPQNSGSRFCRRNYYPIQGLEPGESGQESTQTQSAFSPARFSK